INSQSTQEIWESIANVQTILQNIDLLNPKDAQNIRESIANVQTILQRIDSINPKDAQNIQVSKLNIQNILQRIDLIDPKATYSSQRDITKTQPSEQTIILIAPQDVQKMQTNIANVESILQSIDPQEDQESLKLPPEQTEALSIPASSDGPSCDFFISYNETDTAWAVWIANRVKQAGYSIHIPEQDFKVGFIFRNEMKKAFGRAKRMIVVLSPNYLKAL
ncbi:MAG: toll/interleukin-1 receptor domain-containing protein, partial [Ktedonobacteraceae bacterium]